MFSGIKMYGKVVHESINILCFQKKCTNQSRENGKM